MTDASLLRDRQPVSLRDALLELRMRASDLQARLDAECVKTFSTQGGMIGSAIFRDRLFDERRKVLADIRAHENLIAEIDAMQRFLAAE